MVNKKQVEIAAEEYRKEIEDLDMPFNSWERGLIFSSFRAGGMVNLLRWKKVDKNNLPDILVLMKNSVGGSIVGIIEEWENELMGYHNYPDGNEYKEWALRGATHYISIHELIELPNEQ